MPSCCTPATGATAKSRTPRSILSPRGALSREYPSGSLPVTQSLITLTPAAHLHLSAFCQAEDGHGFILRVWNSADTPVDAVLTTTLPIRDQ